MAACLSPSPSGRRLSELLEEKQEPFCLDIHLLEKGCSSSRLLDGYDTALCWPASGNDAAAVLKRLTSRKSKATAKKQKQSQPAGGLLKLLLSKILHGKAASVKTPRAALQCSESFKFKASAVAPFADHNQLGAVKTTAAGDLNKDKEMKECSHSDSSYSDSDSDDDEKQLSPVSVLDPHPFEKTSLSPVHTKLSPAMDVFRELLDAAYSPALLTQLLSKTDDLIKDEHHDDDEDEDDDEYCYGYYRSSPRHNNRYDDAAYWESHKAELARVSALVASEVPTARLGDADLVAERDDVGAGVAGAVLEALLRELVVDLLDTSSC